jgi:hypothetical protein
MQLVSAQPEPVIADVVVDADMIVEVEGGGVAKLARYVVEEADEDEEEDELSLVRCERRSKVRSDASSLAISERMVRTRP